MADTVYGHLRYSHLGLKIIFLQYSYGAHTDMATQLFCMVTVLSPSSLLQQSLPFSLKETSNRFLTQSAPC